LRSDDCRDAELNSVFAFLGHSTPYLDRAHASMRRSLAEMVASSQRRTQQLSDLIESLGGSPIPRGMQSGEQHLAYLTIQFLMPKLIAAKERDIERYRRVRETATNPVAVILDQMIEEQMLELRVLKETNF
jgi:hypothetical protein